ncbi:Glycosyltransferase, GT2 family [Sesbania bispinosa]|nr:Glycosyltransferase, GT2 family [Sesbania bispinosa]
MARYGGACRLEYTLLLKVKEASDNQETMMVLGSGHNDTIIMNIEYQTYQAAVMALGLVL